MRLETRIMLAATGAVALATVCSIAIVYRLSQRNRIEELRGKMSSIIAQSEQVARNMDDMHKSQVFDTGRLVEASKSQTGGKPLVDGYAATDLYKTIPIVAAWKSVETAAKANGFEFFTPSRPGVRARNPKNDNGSEFAAAFAAFEKGEAEYFLNDRRNDQLVLARPVRLAASCLDCHGDPARSTTADGKDVLGFPMEGMKLDDLKGAFVLKAGIGFDPVVMSTMRWMALGGAVTLGLVLVGFYVFNRRSIARPLEMAIRHLQEAGSEVASASDQITDASQSLAESAGEQAAALEETSASLEELASMTKRNSDNSEKANGLSRETRAAAEKGAVDMQAMAQAMGEIKSSGDDIAKIIKTIDEIAFQTNILALNAAVEAARAGEAGMGFSVVADEVRNLAQRSAVAAKETAAKIEGAISKTNLGVELSVKVASALQDIVAKARQVDELAAEVASASREQSQGITQINAAVSQMDRVTQGNAASAEESASAAQELSSQAGSMRQSVADLIQLVDGVATSGATPRAATTRVAAVRAAAKPAPGGPAKPAPKSKSPARVAAKQGLPVPSPRHGSPATIHAGGDIPMDGDFKDF